MRWNETIMVGRNREIQVAAVVDQIQLIINCSSDQWTIGCHLKDRSHIDYKTVEILSLLSIVFCLPLFSKINQINNSKRDLHYF